ncbi:MAG TPA: hypothetical protein IAB48_01265 [Candidatus Fimimorpha excrementavium]|nr:hypothetical protein [Candidatus Fimimorpha excrementavium]
MKEDPDAPNAAERKRRKHFYLRNGLKETGLFVNVYGTDFELITPDGRLSLKEYVTLLTAILGKGVVEKIRPRPIHSSHDTNT